MSIKIGITGGIGSGKSVVSRLLEIMGIPVYISDIEAKRLTHSDPEIRKQLTELIGQDLFATGELNRPQLASYIFKCTENAEKVNHIIHPSVKRDFRQWALSHQQCDVVGIESAILVEAGFKDEVDYVIMVCAPKEIRIERAMNRDNSSRELITKRVEAQMSDEAKQKHADFILTNDDSTPLIPQVLALISFLSKKKPYLCSAKNN